MYAYGDTAAGNSYRSGGQQSRHSLITEQADHGIAPTAY